MRSYLFVVRSKAQPGRDADYNAWYDGIHIGEVLQRDGFVACQRYAVQGDSGDGRREYVAIYTLESDEPAVNITGLGSAMADGTFTPTDSIDMASVRSELLSPDYV